MSSLALRFSKTCHYFRRRRVHCSPALFTLPHRVAGPWFIAAMNSGSGMRQSFVYADSIKHLLWTNFDIFQAQFLFFLSILFSIGSVPLHSGSKAMLDLTLSQNQFILCEIIVLMASFSPFLLIRFSSLSFSPCHSDISPWFQPQVQPPNGKSLQTLGLDLGLGW